MRKKPTERTLAKWHVAIENGGYTRVRTRTLLAQFGFARRGSAVVAAIQQWLSAQGIHVKGLPTAGIDDSVTLTHEKIESIGALFKKERELEARFEAEIMPRLGLTHPKREYSPRGTRDRFDYLCKDSDGRSVVVELKRERGDKRAVEQVMRYIGQLKHDGTDKNPRGILITGLGDPETRRALEGREKDAHIQWYIYGLVNGRVKLKKMKV